MAKLEELRSLIDNGGEAVLSLAYDHPLNEERKEVKIFIKQGLQGLYSRKFVRVGENPLDSRSELVTWESLLDKEISPVESTSDQWKLVS